MREPTDFQPYQERDHVRDRRQLVPDFQPIGALDPDPVWGVPSYMTHGPGRSAWENHMPSEAEVERRIQANNPTPDRLMPQDIDNVIKEVRFHQFEGTTTTVCCLVLRNGFCVIGQSASADPRNFDEGLGKDIAFDNARRGIWQLEGYLLKQKKYEGEV